MLRDTEGLEMPILLDPDTAVIKQYGVFNEGSTRGIPHPTAVVIDRLGVVRYVRVDEDYKLRPEIAELQAALSGR